MWEASFSGWSPRRLFLELTDLERTNGPWAWANLRQRDIDFGVAPIPGVNGKPGRPFVGVMVAYLNRSSPNQDLAKEFLEHYLLNEAGLKAMNHAKPIGVPALISLYNRMAKNRPLLRELKTAVDYGEIMPNVPEMSRFFSAVGTALQISTTGRASAQGALQEAEANKTPSANSRKSITGSRPPQTRTSSRRPGARYRNKATTRW